MAAVGRRVVEREESGIVGRNAEEGIKKARILMRAKRRERDSNPRTPFLGSHH
jgi:hypothetical protein